MGTQSARNLLASALFSFSKHIEQNTLPPHTTEATTSQKKMFLQFSIESGFYKNWNCLGLVLVLRPYLEHGHTRT